MNHRIRLQSPAAALLNASHHSETHREASSSSKDVSGPGRRAITIALSRESGVLGTSTAREVGARLGWVVYDHELLERMAGEMNLRPSLLESVDEKRGSWLRECMEAFASVPSVSESAYVHHLIQTVFSLASHGECVIVGRGAAQLLPAESTLRVRLVAPIQWRVASLSRRLAISREDAAREIVRIDRERVSFIKNHFHKDAADPSQYDLVLNAARFSVEQCAELIADALYRFMAGMPAPTSSSAMAAK